jgi:magnesium transporter
MKTIKAKNYTWLYFEKPNKKELSVLQKKFNLHPIVLEEFTTPTYRPQIDRHKNYLFLVLHFPIFNEEKRTTEIGEIDIAVNEKFIATSCNKHQDAIFHYFEKKRKTGQSFEKMPADSYLLLFKIVEILLNSCFPKLDHIANNIDKIEKNIFQNQEKKMVKEISIVKRDILNFRRTIKPQRTILESLGWEKNFKDNPNYKTRINNIIGANIRVWNVLENHKETIDSLEATNDSLFSHKLNSAMRILTVFSVIFLPATLTAALFGMNVNVPIKNFWIIAVITVSFMLIMFILVKIKRWL